MSPSSAPSGSGSDDNGATAATGRHRSRSSDVQSPPTLPLEISAPVRIVQKQVVSFRADVKGQACTAVLYLRLAVPTSSKSRSFPLFSDEGVRLKSSIVYPVELAKGNRTVIPPDASNGLKRASRILSLDGSAGANARSREEHGAGIRMPSIDENKSVEPNHSTHKQVKPRIATSSFHITLICPPSRDGPEETLNAKNHFVAVIQIEVGLSLQPPLWPFEIRIPVAPCLNNKLHFTTATDDADEAESDNDAANLTVEFEPPLVSRPPQQVRRSLGRGTPDVTIASADEANEEEDEASEVEAAISGAFPSTDLMTIRWANVQAGISMPEPLLSTLPVTNARRCLLRAERFHSELQVLNVESVTNGSAHALAHVRIQASVNRASFPGLDPIVTLELSFNATKNGQAQSFNWVTESLTVQSEQKQTLQAWSIDSREVAMMSRSPSSSLIPSSSSTLLGQSISTPTHSNGSDSVDTTVEDEDGNLIDVRPPRGIIDVSDTSLDRSASFYDGQSAPFLAPQTAERERKLSLTSIKSFGSEYSQRSALADGLALRLALRNAAVRKAHADKTQDLTFSIEGTIRCEKISDDLGEDSGECVRFSCPALISSHIASHATVCSVTDGVRLFEVESGKILDSGAVITVRDGSNEEEKIEVGFILDQQGDQSEAETSIVAIGDQTGDTSAGTMKPLLERASLFHNDTARPRPARSVRSEESMEVLSFPVSGDASASPDLKEWSGIIERAKVQVWVSNIEGYTGSAQTIAHRHAVHRLEMSWPRESRHVDDKADSLTALLPSVIFAIPLPGSPDRDQGAGKVKMLHASIHGHPVSHSSLTGKGELSSSSSSKILDLQLPSMLRHSIDPISVTLVYSIDLPAQPGDFALFPSVASTVAHLKADISDDCIGEYMPVVSYTSNEPASSSLRSDQDDQTARLDACMVAGMTKITISYAKRTKPLAPFAALTPSGMPANRQADSISAHPPPPLSLPSETEDVNDIIVKLVDRAQATGATNKGTQNNQSVKMDSLLRLCLIIVAVMLSVYAVFGLFVFAFIRVHEHTMRSGDDPTPSFAVPETVQFYAPAHTSFQGTLHGGNSKAVAPFRSQSLSIMPFPVSGLQDIFRWIAHCLTLPFRFVLNGRPDE